MNVRLWFPEWFVPNLENRAYLEGVRGKLPGYQLAIEFRRVRVVVAGIPMAGWPIPPERTLATSARV